MGRPKGSKNVRSRSGNDQGGSAGTVRKTDNGSSASAIGSGNGERDRIAASDGIAVGRALDEGGASAATGNASSSDSSASVSGGGGGSVSGATGSSGGSGPNATGSDGGRTDGNTSGTRSSVDSERGAAGPRKRRHVAATTQGALSVTDVQQYVEALYTGVAVLTRFEGFRISDAIESESIARPATKIINKFPKAVEKAGPFADAIALIYAVATVTTPRIAAYEQWKRNVAAVASEHGLRSVPTPRYTPQQQQSEEQQRSEPMPSADQGLNVDVDFHRQNFPEI